MDNIITHNPKRHTTELKRPFNTDRVSARCHRANSDNIGAGNDSKRGRMTISPPAKVTPYECDDVKVLASNFDKLDLSIDVHWLSENFFEFLKVKKDIASKVRKELPLRLPSITGGEKWACMLKPYGAKGYEWLVEGQEFIIKIGNWLEPQERPSVFVEIRSETLWRLGPEKVLERIVNVLKGQGTGCIVENIKPSRVDLCCDVMMPERLWDLGLIRHKVTRARKSSVYFNNDRIEGIGIGRGTISARLYDKPMEIRQQSNKYWMYLIWGMKEDELPDDQRIVRIEFQLRREAITQLGIDTVWDLLGHSENVWGYCTKKWLKFRSNPGKHHNLRKTFLWWRKIQNGYQGVVEPTPLIRFKAMNAKYEQMVCQVDGLLSSMEANTLEQWNPDGEFIARRDLAAEAFQSAASAIGRSPVMFSETVEEKRYKYKRSKEKALSVHERRLMLGFPSNLEVGDKEKEKDHYGTLSDNKRVEQSY